MSNIMEEQKAKAEAAFERLNSLMNIVLGAANTVAGKAVYDAREHLAKDKHLWKHSMKRYMNEACHAYDSYEKAHMRNFGDRYRLFLDYLDSVEDGIQPHVDCLRFSIKQVLDRHGEPRSSAMAYVQTARTLVEYSCGVYDKMIEETKEQSGMDFDSIMRPARLTRCLHAMNMVCSVMCRTRDDTDINLNDDSNCCLAFRIIETKMTSEDFLNKAGFEALSLNPETRKYVSEEDYNELQEKYGI
ncbi:MAG: hypothetical protein K2G12_10795 [Prevotella sp.]|nr:hypothetical protein [Prevotella sp.]